ncbi:MAG: DUF2760 domain-containing protein [Planctomycetota bacterium]|nr:DUF2760 domain-containing protein [Planctomycetota bacterium]MDA1139229.1 DUF2760 domain-containing protein [Planctomycetota bacterium]
MGRFGLALKVLFDGEFAEEVRQLAAPSKEPAEVEDQMNYEAVHLLALLQREGRLVDFLREDIQQFQDAQIGAAARSVHEGCAKVLADYFSVEPVMKEGEGDPVIVPKGFDPSAVKLVGQVTGDPPFKGTLAHHGWKASRAELPERPEGQDKTVIGQAEVEVSS